MHTASSNHPAHRVSTRTPLMLGCLWAVLTVIRFLFCHEINDRLWVGSLLIDGLLLLLALVVIVIGILAAWGPGRRFSHLAVAGMVAGLTVLLWVTPSGRLAGTYFRMWRSESAYQQVVTDLARDPSSKPPRNVRIEAGPPLRIAFSWGGVIDNWHGIVHDPSGEVLKAGKFKADWSNWGDPDLQAVKSLFGGDMRSARHLWGSWYYCTFT